MTIRSFCKVSSWFFALIVEKYNKHWTHAIDKECQNDFKRTCEYSFVLFNWGRIHAFSFLGSEVCSPLQKVDPSHNTDQKYSSLEYQLVVEPLLQIFYGTVPYFHHDMKFVFSDPSISLYNTTNISNNSGSVDTVNCPGRALINFPPGIFLIIPFTLFTLFYLFCLHDFSRFL